MARPIEPTPPVYGEDAERIIKELFEGPQITEEESDRRIASALKHLCEVTRCKACVYCLPIKIAKLEADRAEMLAMLKEVAGKFERSITVQEESEFVRRDRGARKTLGEWRVAIARWEKT